MSQSSGIFPVVKIFSVSISVTSFSRYIFKYLIFSDNTNSPYPSKKYTFGISSVTTDNIELVNFSSAMLIVSYVVESYVTKSFSVSTLYLSPHSTMIPLEPLSIPYLSTKSGLLSDVTASTFIFSFAL